MTKIVRDVVENSPLTAKVILGVLTLLFAFNTITAAAQYWLYAQDQRVREEFSKSVEIKCITQDKRIDDITAAQNALKSRQDYLSQRQEGLAAANMEQDRRVAEQYVAQTQYRSDLSRIEGYFQRIETKLDSHMTNEPVLRKKY